jgi:putative zinc finger/helix-turn-helix YgiT family protein
MPADLCFNCGTTTVQERIEPYVVKHNGKSRTISDRRLVCAQCATVSYPGELISLHEGAVAVAIREMDGLLSAEDLLRIRTKYRFRQTDMEQMLSIGPKTWTRWERGKVPQSKAADTLIRVIADDPEVARRLMEQAGVQNAEASAVFQQIQNKAKSLARAVLRADVTERAQSDVEIEGFVEKVFSTVGEAWRQAAKAEAA